MARRFFSERRILVEGARKVQKIAIDKAVRLAAQAARAAALSACVTAEAACLAADSPAAKAAARRACAKARAIARTACRNDRSLSSARRICAEVVAACTQAIAACQSNDFELDSRQARRLITEIEAVVEKTMEWAHAAKTAAGDAARDSQIQGFADHRAYTALAARPPEVLSSPKSSTI